MFVIALAYLAFLSIALPDSMLGVAWPSMRVSFDQSLGAAGLIPPVGVAAAIASALGTRYVVARIGMGRLLAASTVVSAAGLVISAASPRFEVFLAGVVVLGLSGGAIDVALNAYAARRFGPRRMSFMHASYVVGAAASPALVTVALEAGASWRLSYAIIAVIQLLLAGVFAAGASRWDSDGITPTLGETQSAQERPRLFTVPSSIGIAAVVVQTGIESGAALWAYSFLTLSAGVSAGVAGTTISGFWLMMFISRTLLGSLAENVGSWATMSVGALGLLVAAGTTLLGTIEPTAALVGVLLFGIATGPMYPLLILTTPDRTTPAGIDRLIAAQTVAETLASATLPLLFGLAMNASPSAFAPMIGSAAVAAALLQLALRIWRSTTQAPRHRVADLLLAADQARQHATPAPQPLLGPAGPVWANDHNHRRSNDRPEHTLSDE